MGYYTRVLSTASDCMPISTLRAALAETGHHGVIDIEAGEPSAWTELVLRHAGGPEITAIERNTVENGSLSAEEIEEFIDEIADARPESAVQWLREFFPRVACIYAFQHLSGADQEAGFEMLSAVRTALWSSAPAILQADGEGFSNEDGYHILWQFSESVTGLWWMGVLKDGKWIHFEMDLGNKDQRHAFLAGQVPEGVQFAD